MKNKTIQIHTDRIKKGKFTKSEINALTKLISSQRFADEDRRLEITDFINENFNYSGLIDHNYNTQQSFECELHLFNKPCTITKEQTTLGKNWLKNHYFKLNGTTRKCAELVGERVVEIAKNVSRFEFVGVLIIYSTSYGRQLSQTLPVYRTYNRARKYFDYSPIHWGQPIVMEGN